MERKRAGGRFVREGIDEGESEAPVKAKTGAPRAKACRSYTRKRLAEALPDIAEIFVSEAKKGSIPHTKLLIKLGGLDGKELPIAKQRRGKSLAGKLLEALTRKPANVVAETGEEKAG